jgi:2-polyprenyl-6-methoxyphenol hydroxylase-like FAD-dependent oxidoreductase
LALAIALQQVGVDYLLVDKLARGENTSRAGVIHAHTLEVLDQLGVGKQLAERGLKVPRFTIRDRDRALMQLPFDTLPSTHPYLLTIPQGDTESIMADHLAALGGAIHRGVMAVDAVQDDKSATVRVETQDGRSAIRARYVVGGDGMNSMVRTAAGLDFDGGSYAESFVLADVRMDWPLEASEVSLFFSPAGLLVVAPFPDGSFRIVATLDSAPKMPTLEDIQAIIVARGPAQRKSVVRNVIWSSHFRVHHRLARSYRKGRFFLMGDAAHVHSPAGGQGMNTGLVDAVFLGQLLASILRGERPESDVDAYEQMRRPAAAQVLGLAGQLTKIAILHEAPKRAIRNAILSLIGVLPPARRRLLMNLSGLGRKELAVIPVQQSLSV